MASDLCSDAIFEILTRASLTTLGICRLACKEWNRLTYDSSFVDLHGKRTNTVSGYIFQSLVHNKHETEFVSLDQSRSISLDFLPSGAKIEATSDHGILVCVKQTQRFDRYYVCNPTTKQVVALPSPKARYWTKKVVLVVCRMKPLHYRIIRLSWPRRMTIGSTEYRTEIFDSKTRTWNEAGRILLPFGELIEISKPAVSSKGAIYFLTSNDHMLEFTEDLSTGSCSFRYSLIPLPFKDSSYENKQLMKYEGELGVFCKAPNGQFELWILNKNHAWKKKNNFDDSDIILINNYQTITFNKSKGSNFHSVKLKYHPETLFAFRSNNELNDLSGRG